MKIARLGEVNKERPALIIEDSQVIFVDDYIPDWNRDALENNALIKIRQLDIEKMPREKLSSYRIGSPIARPTKVICVGLNYAQHAIETGATPPPEPVIFMKAPDTVIGGFDEIKIPPNSIATDYEVELCVVIAKKALYLPSIESANDYILGYTISQDVSERHWQTERSGQWVKGKSFPTFNPMGPWIVTSDQINPNDLRLICKVDDEIRQDSKTSDLIFTINHCVWYISQFMELYPGDVINTGTPQGVGMGFSPPKYLKGGEVLETSIEGIGTIKSRVAKT